MSKSRLGAGASSLLGGVSQENQEIIHFINIDLIEPNKEQPRQYFDEEKLAELAQSIKQNGILQPLLVEKQGLHYLLIAGERRLRAAKIAGLTTVPIITKHFSDEQKIEVALIENIQREDLKPIEQAKTYEQLLSLLQLSHEELAHRLGKSRSAITNTLRLLQLPNHIQEAVELGKISAGHARALLSLEEDEDMQQKLYDIIIKDAISVRQTEERAKEFLKQPKTKAQKRNPPRSKELVHTEKKLIENLGVKIQIKGDDQRGMIVIRYHSQEKLHRIISLLEYSDDEKE